MSGVATAGALLLSAVFGVAAVAKLRRPAATRAAFAALGLPAPALVARLVPAAELAIAVTLVARPAIGGAASLVALAAFTAAIARPVLSGQDVRCGCFGSAAQDPVGPAELARNAMLAGLAVAALGAGEPSAPGLAEVVLVSTAASAGAVLLALLRLRGDVGAVWATVLPGEALGREKAA